MKNLKPIICFILILLVLSVVFNVLQYGKYKKFESDIIKKNEQIEALKGTIKEIEQKNEIRHPIFIKEEKCIKSCFGDTACMSECVDNSIPKWDKEILGVLNELKTFLLPEDYKKLLKAQENWENYRKIQTDLTNKYIAQKSGLIHINYATGIYSQITEDRASNISSFLKSIKEE